MTPRVRLPSGGLALLACAIPALLQAQVPGRCMAGPQACPRAPAQPLEATPQDIPSWAAEGAQVFQDICNQCHSLVPPAKLAPPMTHVARHLRFRFGSQAEVSSHVRTFVPAPDSARSVLPAMARQRFGLMPPLPLPEPMLEAVARYVWYLGSEPAPGAR